MTWLHNELFIVLFFNTFLCGSNNYYNIIRQCFFGFTPCFRLHHNSLCGCQTSCSVNTISQHNKMLCQQNILLSDFGWRVFGIPAHWYDVLATSKLTFNFDETRSDTWKMGTSIITSIVHFNASIINEKAFITTVKRSRLKSGLHYQSFCDHSQ